MERRGVKTQCNGETELGPLHRSSHGPMCVPSSRRKDQRASKLARNVEFGGLDSSVLRRHESASCGFKSNLALQTRSSFGNWPTGGSRQQPAGGYPQGSSAEFASPGSSHCPPLDMLTGLLIPLEHFWNSIRLTPRSPRVGATSCPSLFCLLVWSVFHETRVRVKPG
jgi:hypothetical protein